MAGAKRQIRALGILVTSKEIRDVDRPSFEHCPARHPLGVEQLSLTEDPRHTERPEVRTGHHNATVAEQDQKLFSSSIWPAANGPASAASPSDP
jgi:hypothetical protein